jgi:hypothetical protein
MMARLLWECNRKNSLPVDLEKDELKSGLPDLPEVSVLWRRRLLQGSPQNSDINKINNLQEVRLKSDKTG